ncbi:hypothetical protein FD755_002405 [Muntiacus reevesi]|uniref:F5/8 type C domain-containing protein n=1 Tax=Muntiacus reevesi TaxID=9886 RepID=A0A5J5N766_MUNRE|nr:hypothetical protein FD755_002405 [Muntiacus reevesi]
MCDHSPRARHTGMCLESVGRQEDPTMNVTIFNVCHIGRKYFSYMVAFNELLCCIKRKFLFKYEKNCVLNTWEKLQYKDSETEDMFINLQRKMRVTGVITQGAKRIGSPEYIKSYKIAYSNDGKTWTMYKAKGTSEDMVFHGNVDNNTPYANSFTPPIKAQYVRLYPQVCRRHCTLRMELLGCELSGCSEPLGMKSGHIQDYQITASSIFRTLNMDMFTWEPRKARLDKQGKVNAWTSGHNDQSQWLQVGFIYVYKTVNIYHPTAQSYVLHSDSILHIYIYVRYIYIHF